MKYQKFIARDGNPVFCFDFEGCSGVVYKKGGGWECLIPLPRFGASVMGAGATRENAVFDAKLLHKTITLREAICQQKAT